jgi:alpha-beta hydrolase superfamily lysophospholipase
MKILADYLKSNPSFQVENIPLSFKNTKVPIFARRFSRRVQQFNEVEQAEVRLVLVHGLGEYHLRHLDLIEFLLKDCPHVQEVIAYDHAGHGFSGGISNFVDDFDAFSKDLFELVSMLNEQRPLKNIVLGQSMGGLVVLNFIRLYFADYSDLVSGLVFSAPCVRSKFPKIPWLQRLYENNQQLLPQGLKKFILPVIYSGKDITSDPKKAEQFDQDPYIKPFTSLHLGMEIMRITDQIKEVPYMINCPCLFLVPGDDVLVDPYATKLFAESIDKDFVTFISYESMKHDLFNEVEAEKVYRDLADWVEKYGSSN